MADTRERLPDWTAPGFDPARMRTLMQILDRRLGGINQSLEELLENSNVTGGPFAPLDHDHDWSDIINAPDFLTIEDIRSVVVLNDLADVNDAGKVIGQTIVWNGLAYVPGGFASGAQNLYQLLDTLLPIPPSAPNDQDLLTYNAALSKWTNLPFTALSAANAAGPMGPPGMDGLDGVDGDMGPPGPPGRDGASGSGSGGDSWLMWALR